MSNFLQKVFLLEILKGMALTLKSMFSKPVTVMYPFEKKEPKLGFRGLHALATKDDGSIRCVGCGLCAAICPSQCISIFTSEGSGHEKVVDRYEVDTLRCLFCGLCVEACPYKAIVLTDIYEYSGYTKEEFIYTKERLVKNWNDFVASGKADKYFERFWRPQVEDFTGSENQAVFKGKKS